MSGVASSKYCHVNTYMVPMNQDRRIVVEMAKRAILAVLISAYRVNPDHSLWAKSIVRRVDTQGQLEDKVLFRLIDEPDCALIYKRDHGCVDNKPQSKYRLANCMGHKVHDLRFRQDRRRTYYNGEWVSAQDLASSSLNIHGLDRRSFNYRIHRLNQLAEYALSTPRTVIGGRTKSVADWDEVGEDEFDHLISSLDLQHEMEVAYAGL